MGAVILSKRVWGPAYDFIVSGVSGAEDLRLLFVFQPMRTGMLTLALQTLKPA